MKALSLWQPWASLLVAGVKTIETRSWATHYRGPLAIHATQITSVQLMSRLGLTVRGMLALEDVVVHNWRVLYPSSVPNDAGYRAPTMECLPRGCIVGMVNVFACVEIPPSPIEGWAGTTVCGRPLTEVELALGDYTPGRFAWVCEDPVAFAEPIPCRGRQGLWNVPAAIAEQIQEVTR